MSPVELRCVPGLAALPRDHSALLLAEGELRADLRAARISVRDKRVPAPDTKGWQTDLALSLSGPAGIAGVTAVFKAWLARDRRRSITVTRAEQPDGSTAVTITGDAVSDETVRLALERLLGPADEPGHEEAD
ncbi:hypothetical protein GCM10010168_27950 [Actinoplanes ianthinogenes]|uniref:Uncharacterized protein n=1 Tax=Actinoplanes ianthinogenes TaxID=122358 RepID=A0ABM7LKZ2_9ACTN|nr:hypothetical protein [Actinoplanes ianthinogenes]BCJ39936.1 hypothetical protein Aiant_05930 [Actinoplanes ianthinogenes]GGR09138.1 hypothetical protein GCM10010168_27950 [Actinoplanes ianthinogenes]